MAKQKSTAVSAARQHANELRKEEAQRLRRRRALIQTGVITVALILLAAIVLAIASGTRGGGSADRPTTAPTQSSDATSPVTIGTDFVRHGAADAPVTVALYEDYSCPHCQDYEALVGDTLTELVDSGDVAVEYHPVRIVTNYGNRAGSTAACVAEGDPASWPGVHTSLFAIHDGETDGWSNDQLREHVSGLGVTEPSVLDCITEGRFENWIDDNTAAARDAGVNATPTLIIDGEATQMLDPAGLRAAVAQALSAG